MSHMIRKNCNEHIILMARPPVLGRVKSRIAAEKGTEEALSIYEELLSKAINLLSNLPEKMRKTIAWSEMGSQTCKDKFEPWEQCEGNLGDRMFELMSKAIRENSKKVILIGADCPYITVDIIEQGFTLLSSSQTVLGPAEDGGYYLAGANRITPELFPHVKWGTSDVLKKTIENLVSKEIKYKLLTELSDIDTWEDWQNYLNSSKFKE